MPHWALCLVGRFFLNFMRREKNCFSVSLPRFLGDVTCLPFGLKLGKKHKDDLFIKNS